MYESKQNVWMRAPTLTNGRRVRVAIATTAATAAILDVREGKQAAAMLLVSYRPTLTCSGGCCEVLWRDWNIGTIETIAATRGQRCLCLCGNFVPVDNAAVTTVAATVERVRLRCARTATLSGTGMDGYRQRQWQRQRQRQRQRRRRGKWRNENKQLGNWGLKWSLWVCEWKGDKRYY